jgi:hypothetical protein
MFVKKLRAGEIREAFATRDRSCDILTFATMKIAHPAMWHRIVWRWRLGRSRCSALRSGSFSPEEKSRFSHWVELFGFQNLFEYIVRNIKILSWSACLMSCPGLGLLIAYSRAGQLLLTGGPRNSYGTRPRATIVYTYIGGGRGGAGGGLN